MLDPNRKERCKFLGCEPGDKTDDQIVMERVKKQIQNRTKQITE